MDFSDFSDGASSECSELTSPLSLAHTTLHEKASPILIGLFHLHQQDFEDAKARDLLLNKLCSVNDAIRRLNFASRTVKDMGLGTIDIDVFFFAWDQLYWEDHLEAFCRTHHYPVQWARNPPEVGSDYLPYAEQYWENCSWPVVEILLQSIWRLRRSGAEETLINKQEAILFEYETDFNKELKELHRKHGNRSSKAFFLEAHDLVEAYSLMADCLEKEQFQETYETCRKALISQCSLYGYPLKWVPGTFQEEIVTTRGVN